MYVSPEVNCPNSSRFPPEVSLGRWEPLFYAQPSHQPSAHRLRELQTLSGSLTVTAACLNVQSAMDAGQ